MRDLDSTTRSPRRRFVRRPAALRALPLALALSLVAIAVSPARGEAPTVTAASPASCGFAGKPPAGVTLHRIRSTLLGRDVPFAVISPRHAPPGPLPLLVLLHGLGAKPAAFVQGPRVHGVIAEAVARGSLPEAIVVMPSGGDAYWTDWADGRHPWAAMVVNELVPAVRAAFAVADGPDRTAIAGLSMGGFGALSIGLRHPQVFGSIVALSPTDMRLALLAEPTRPVYTRVFGSPADPSAVAGANPRDLVEAGAGDGQRVTLVVGDAEPPKFHEGTVALAQAMQDRGMDVALRVVPGGGHDFRTTWTRASLDWCLTRLAEAWRSPERSPTGAPR
jgi:enterochelin esterase-like enzyme